jgi:peptidoglycan/xylan/chitin deacetylase (PgdA/CDA1 family)
MKKIIYDIAGVETDLIRFPGGSSNTVSKSYCVGIMGNLAKMVQERGYQYFDWNVTSGDAGGTKSKAQVVKNVISGIQSNKMSVVLQHDIKDFSVNAVPEIIEWALENGYCFDTLSQTGPTVHHSINN